MNDSPKTSDCTTLYLNRKDFNNLTFAHLKTRPPKDCGYVLLPSVDIILRLDEDIDNG